MLLADVVQTSRRVAGTAKRLEKIDLLANLLRQLTPEEVEIVTAFLSGGPRQGRIGIGYATLHDARGPAVEGASLSILDVDRALIELAALKGRGSDGQKRNLLSGIFSRATSDEQQFLTGLLGGELRQGALEGIMLDALAKAANIPADRVRRAAMMAGSVTAIARPAMESGEAGLTEYDIRLFRPVQPMLAQTAEDVAEALEDLGEAALEFKLDGARVQVHKSGDEVAVYTRQLNNVTAAVPEVVHAVRGLGAKDLILDGEVLSIDPEGRPHPFQVTMRRFGRKLEVEKLASELPIQPFWFDLIYADGGALLDETQSRRFAELQKIAPAEMVIPHLRTADRDQAEDFLHDAIGRGHEGIMAKAPGAVYAAGGRGQSWLKIKKARTLDLVILAAEWGNGRRQGLLSNLHLGARNVARGGFAMLGKTFKGLTDEMLAWQTEEFLKLEVTRDRYTVYVQPKVVVEIAFNEIQVSSRYESGLALRFARVKRYRPDKAVESSDTFETVQKMAGLGGNSLEN